MHPLATLTFANLHHRELSDHGLRRREPREWRRPRRADQRPASSVTVRLATAADRPALERLAELEQSVPPAAPVLLGVVMERPVAALSLRDEGVLADPFTPTRDLVELLRLRARQLARA